MTPSEIEKALEEKIDPWLAHMRWRADFAEWRRRRIHQEEFQKEFVEDVTRAAGNLAGKRVLDLGAGMGGFAVALERCGARVTALDYNPSYCEITQLRGLRYGLDMQALTGAGEALPFSDDTFDMVTCWDVIEHVQNAERVLAEIARVTRPGGTIVLTVINRYALVDPHYHLRFVNWLPRVLGEKYIALRGRAKGGQFRDRQALSGMHYFTFGGFSRLAGLHGYAVSDLNRPKSRLVRKLPPPLGIALYQMWRTIGMGTYRLELHHQNPAHSVKGPASEE